MSLEDIIKFAKNPSRRFLLELLIDTSSSMSGQSISELNAGIATFKQERDVKVCNNSEIAIITFGGEKPQLAQDFITFKDFIPPQFTTKDMTSLGQGIELAIEKLEARQETLKRFGIDYYQPWIFLISDSAPTDDLHNAINSIKLGVTNKKFTFFVIGTQNAEPNILQQISSSQRPPLFLNGLKFRELFFWLSTSMKNILNTQPGDQVQFPPVSSWAKL